MIDRLIHLILDIWVFIFIGLLIYLYLEPEPEIEGRLQEESTEAQED